MNDKEDPCLLIQKTGSWETELYTCEAIRLKRDLERHLRYKTTLSHGRKLRGNIQSFWWIVNFIWTDYRYPKAARVANVYYECWHLILPLIFEPSEADKSVKVTFLALSSNKSDNKTLHPTADTSAE